MWRSFVFTLQKRSGRFQGANSTINWYLLNFYWIINNYLFTIFAMICLCRRSCPVILCKIYTFCACQKKEIIIWFLWKNNFSRTIDKTICHFSFTPRTFHTSTLHSSNSRLSGRQAVNFLFSLYSAKRWAIVSTRCNFQVWFCRNNIHFQSAIPANTRSRNTLSRQFAAWK